jgi:hypothetical protein
MRAKKTSEWPQAYFAIVKVRFSLSKLDKMKKANFLQKECKKLKTS